MFAEFVATAGLEREARVGREVGRIDDQFASRQVSRRGNRDRARCAAATSSSASYAVWSSRVPGFSALASGTAAISRSFAPGPIDLHVDVLHLHGLAGLDLEPHDPVRFVARSCGCESTGL